MSFWRLYFFFFFYLFFYTINLSTNFRLFTEFYRSTLHISFILCLSFISFFLSFLIHVFSYRLIKLSLIFLTPWISWKFYFYLYLYLYIGLEATYKRAWMYLIVIVKYVEGKLCCLYFYLTKKLGGRARGKKISHQGRKEACNHFFITRKHD